MGKCKMIAHLLKDRAKSQILELQNNREVRHCSFVTKCIKEKNPRLVIFYAVAVHLHFLFHPAWVLGPSLPNLQMLSVKMQLYGWLERHLLGFMWVSLTLVLNRYINTKWYACAKKSMKTGADKRTLDGMSCG